MASYTKFEMTFSSTTICFSCHKYTVYAAFVKDVSAKTMLSWIYHFVVI
jgi:hypothetical protein